VWYGYQPGRKVKAQQMQSQNAAKVFSTALNGTLGTASAPSWKMLKTKKKN